MEKKILIEQLTEDIISYVMHGEISKDFIAEKIKYEELDQRFEEYDKLIRLHFILREDVTEFVKDLEHHLREIKTETQRRKEVRNGSIEGRIDWSKTYRERYQRIPGNTALFVCENRTEDYDIPENLVLKRLLSEIYQTLEDAEKILEKDYEWINESWDEDLVKDMRRIFKGNVHVKRISKPKKYEPTDRMVQQALDSRNKVYRNAAEKLIALQKLREGDREEMERLLESTAITPDDRETLLELFVLFKFISVIQENSDKKIKMKTMKAVKKDKKHTASLQDEEEIRLYHNTSGRDGMKFKDKLKGKNSEEYDKYGRSQKIQVRTREIYSEYTGIKQKHYTERPDVLALEMKDGNDFKYIITEVKDSTSNNKIKEGIRETLRYLAFMQLNEDYRTNDDEVFGNCNGLLVIQDLDEEDRNEDEADDQDFEIEIAEVSEVEETVKQMLIEGNMIKKIKD